MVWMEVPSNKICCSATPLFPECQNVLSFVTVLYQRAAGVVLPPCGARSTPATVWLRRLLPLQNPLCVPPAQAVSWL